MASKFAVRMQRVGGRTRRLTGSLWEFSGCSLGGGYSNLEGPRLKGKGSQATCGNFSVSPVVNLFPLKYGSKRHTD